ncbi:protein translocase subunit SecF [Vibrio alfacsensis]|uniref:protein translocase subunit SecF n=1 Tax=Vibrio alfacsensis TaxID=1074311 RepID=UPI001BEE3896|nr:protein translocase subunit SecF [Vibrio alfacsensis]WQE78053.1 protein translocase subunit SecF [Vibrio alfacsensis]BCN25891.1 protein-export membrane protein SecF [Vibrio alfacsensis]
MFKYALTRWRYIGLVSSLILVFASILSVYQNGLSMSIDFTGGTIIDVQIQTLLNASDLQMMIHGSLKDTLIIRNGAEPGLWQLVMPANSIMTDPYQIVSTVSEQFSLPVTLVQASVVGPQVGEELFNQGGLALLAASLSIMGYLAIRFEWRLALAAIASLIHDTILTFGLLAFLGIKIDLNVVAGLLAVIGYSLNDSIVIADRLRDVLRAKPDMSIYANTDLAVRATFARTLVTAGTTLFIIGCLLVLGGEALYGFSMTMFAGVLTGTWSSVTIASTVQELLGLSPEHYQTKPDLVDDMP